MSARFLLSIALDKVNEESVLQFRFEPGRLRRHDLTHVGNSEKIVHRRRKQRERDSGLSFVDDPFQFVGPANTADKFQPFTGGRIGDAKDRTENVVLKDADVESLDRVGRADVIYGEPERVPFAVEIHSYLTRIRRNPIAISIGYDKVLANAFEKFLY